MTMVNLRHLQALSTANSINDVFAIIEEIGTPSPHHVAQVMLDPRSDSTFQELSN